MPPPCASWRLLPICKAIQDQEESSSSDWRPMLRKGMQRHSLDVPGIVTAFPCYEGAVGTELFTLLPKNKSVCRDVSPNLQLREGLQEPCQGAANKSYFKNGACLLKVKCLRDPGGPRGCMCPLQHSLSSSGAHILSRNKAMLRFSCSQSPGHLSPSQNVEFSV